MEKSITIVLAFMISLVTFLSGVEITRDKYEAKIEKIRKENKTLRNDITNIATQLINSNDRECQYYIEKAEDGFIIDGQLYKED